MMNRVFLLIASLTLWSACDESGRTVSAHPELQMIRIKDTVATAERVKLEFKIANDEMVDYSAPPRLFLIRQAKDGPVKTSLPFKNKRGYYRPFERQRGQYDIEVELVCKLKNGLTQKLRLKDHYYVRD